MPDVQSFQVGDIITDEAVLEKIGCSACFEEYDPNGESNKTPIEKGDE